MVGKSHLGARSPANLPINRGFDYHFGFLKGGEDHYTQGSGSANGEGNTVDLWHGHALSNMTGIYSGYLYAHKAVGVISNYSSSTVTAATRSSSSSSSTPHAPHTHQGLFMYLAWHNTHTPLECPEEWMYPPLYNDSTGSRMTYNCMSRILDDGIGNVTAALTNAGLWDGTLMLFAADNGGWVGGTGSNNYPLKGSKVSDFEGGVRAVSFLAGGHLPASVHGTHHTGYISIADWYGTLASLVGVDPTDAVPGLPPVDSNDFWPSILTPNANHTGRTDIFLSWSCVAKNANVSGCDPAAPDWMYANTSGDPNVELNVQGDMALISNQYKIIMGTQCGRGIWFGPVYPNRTSAKDDKPSYPCQNGCLYDIVADPTEHANLKDTLPGVYAAMLSKLLAHGRTVFQTDYKEPGTDQCFTGAQAAAYYVGHNTCIKGKFLLPEHAPIYHLCVPMSCAFELSIGLNPPVGVVVFFQMRGSRAVSVYSDEMTVANVAFTGGPGYNPSLPSCDATRKQLYLGPMCFKTLPPVPPVPPPPPPPQMMAIAPAGAADGGCLVTNGQRFAPVVLGACADGRHWLNSASGGSMWVAWAGAGAGGPSVPAYLKVDQQAVKRLPSACQRGEIFVNPDQGPPGSTTAQGFAVERVNGTAQVQLVSSACSGLCLGFETSADPACTGLSGDNCGPAGPAPGTSPKAIPCAKAMRWIIKTAAAPAY